MEKAGETEGEEEAKLDTEGSEDEGYFVNPWKTLRYTCRDVDEADEGVSHTVSLIWDSSVVDGTSVQELMNDRRNWICSRKTLTIVS